MSYSLKPVPPECSDLAERLRFRAIEIDHRLGPIPGYVADSLVRDLKVAADAISGNAGVIERMQVGLKRAHDKIEEAEVTHDVWFKET